MEEQGWARACLLDGGEQEKRALCRGVGGRKPRDEEPGLRFTNSDGAFGI